MLFALLTVVHIFVCLVLIAVILLQAGRGGGMSEMIGSGQPSSIFGTQTNAFMTRATEVCAVIFIVTSLSLGILTTQKGKSLVEKERFARNLKTQLPASASAVDASETAATGVTASTQEAAKATAVAPNAAPKSDGQ